MKKFISKLLIISLIITSTFFNAKFDDIYAEPFKVIFNFNGYGEQVSVVPNEWNWVTLPEVIYSGDDHAYAFVGWYKDNNTFNELLTDSKLNYYVDEPLTEDLNVYAKWVATVNISGNVKSNGENIENIDINIKDLSNPMIIDYNTQTDEDGNYSFDVPQNSLLNITLNNFYHLTETSQIQTYETDIDNKDFALTRILYEYSYNKNFTQIQQGEYVYNITNDYSSEISITIDDQEPIVIQPEGYYVCPRTCIVVSMSGNSISLSKISNLDDIKENEYIAQGEIVFIDGDLNIYDINDNYDAHGCSSGYVFVADKIYYIKTCETGWWKKLDITNHVHVFNELLPTYTWSNDFSTCTATYECSHATEPHTITETVDSYKSIQSDANNFENEFSDLIASFSNNLYFETQYKYNEEIPNTKIDFKWLDNQAYVYDGDNPIVIKTTYTDRHNVTLTLDNEEIDEHDSDILFMQNTDNLSYYDCVLSTYFLDKLYYIGDTNNHILKITIDNGQEQDQYQEQSIEVPINIPLTYKTADFSYTYDGNEIYYVDGAIKNGDGLQCEDLGFSYSNNTYKLTINSINPIELSAKDADVIRTHNGKNLEIVGNGTINIIVDTTNQKVEDETPYHTGILCDGNLSIKGSVSNDNEYGININIIDKYCRDTITSNDELNVDIYGFGSENGDVEIENAKIIGKLSNSFLQCFGKLSIIDSYVEHQIYTNYKTSMHDDLEYPKVLYSIMCGGYQNQDVMENDLTPGFEIINSNVISNINNEKNSTAKIMSIGIASQCTTNIEDSLIDFTGQHNDDQMFALGGDMSMGIALMNENFEIEEPNEISMNFINSKLNLKNYFIGAFSFIDNINFVNTDVNIDTTSSCIFTLGKINLTYDDTINNHEFNLSASNCGNFIIDGDDPRNTKFPIIFTGLDISALEGGNDSTFDYENSFITNLGKYYLSSNLGGKFIKNNIPSYSWIKLTDTDPSINPHSDNRHIVLDTSCN